MALAAIKSGTAATDVEQLAALGNFGRNENHIAGQITTRFCKSQELSLPEPYFFEAPVLKKGSDSWYLASHKLAVFLPHEWFAWMEQHDSVSGASGLVGFWDEHDVKDPKLHYKPLKDNRHQCLPFMVHGDGGAYQKWDSITVLSFRSLLCDQNVSTSQMLLAAVPKTCQTKSDDPKLDTMTVVWEVLAWSF